MQPPSLSRIRRPPTCRSMSPTQFRFYVNRVYRAYACSSKLPAHDSTYFYECTLLCNIIRKKIDIGFHRDMTSSRQIFDWQRRRSTQGPTNCNIDKYHEYVCNTHTYCSLDSLARKNLVQANTDPCASKLKEDVLAGNQAFLRTYVVWVPMCRVRVCMYVRSCQRCRRWGKNRT